MSLESEFRPTGDHAEWWPTTGMRAITPDPTEWVKIVERTRGSACNMRSCALIPLADVPQELSRDRSLVFEVGDVEVSDDRFWDGLSDPFNARAEFFCQVRQVEPFTELSIEWSWPFLWYWRAVRQGDKWIYLDSAGRNVELARVHVVDAENYFVEIRAMALRQYLHRRKMAMLVDLQLEEDHSENGPVEREEYFWTCDWASMAFRIYSYDSILAGPSEVTVSSLDGQYVILPAEHAVGPDWCGDDAPTSYPDFIYDVDPRSGESLTVQPTQENVGSDGYPGRFFWTRIYFKAEVLERYLAEPNRYTVQGSRIECLNKWMVSIGETSDHLIEMDLSDLAQIPWREWSHWKAYNVAPSGGLPDEGKLRRERLNQPWSSPDIVRDLHTALREANEAARQLTGWPIWRPLAGSTDTEWQALHVPVVEDRAALQRPILTLSKVLVDSIDSSSLRQALANDPPSGAGSLTLLKQYIEESGGSPEDVRPLRDLQELRSRGGIAHYGGTHADEVLERIAGDAKTPAEIFTRVCLSLIGALEGFARIFSETMGRDTNSPEEI